MATEFDYKSKLLESIIESLQCFNCKDVPGFMKDQRNRYSCFEKSHQLCENCKDKCECGSLVVKFPNPIVKQMLKELPMYCMNYKRGCREIFAEPEGKVIHPKYYKHLKKGAHQSHLGRQKMDWFLAD